MDNLPPDVHPSQFDDPPITEHEFTMDLSTGERVEIEVRGNAIFPEIWMRRDNGTWHRAEDELTLDDWFTFWNHQR
jgi:hypothetical protein